MMFWRRKFPVMPRTECKQASALSTPCKKGGSGLTVDTVAGSIHVDRGRRGNDDVAYRNKDGSAAAIGRRIPVSGTNRSHIARCRCSTSRHDRRHRRYGRWVAARHCSRGSAISGERCILGRGVGQTHAWKTERIVLTVARTECALNASDVAVAR
jgi:hypothetical protein